LDEIRFYFDESVELVVSLQIAVNGLDAVSAHSLDALGDSDANHLQRAARLGRVLCTYDADFLRLAASGAPHSGIIYAREQTTTVGMWIRELRMIASHSTPESLRGRVIFLRSGR
jgi:predicted nuclease of predicted toxin-antitoxin system